MNLKKIKVVAAMIALFSLTVMVPEGAFATLQCYDCHGSRNDQDYRPLDSSLRDFPTGGFQGNHRTHLGSSSGAASCAKCHPGSDSFTTNHRNGTINLSPQINASPLPASYRNVTSILQTVAPTLGSCTNVNCHFEKTTPVWGTQNLFQLPNDCLGSCHNSPPDGGSGGADGSHSIHSTYFPGLNNCRKCHPDHTVAPLFAHATSAANRGPVVKPSDPIFGTFGDYTASRKDFLPSQTNRFSVCYNFYCHSSAQGLTDPTQPPTTLSPPTWGKPWSGYTYSNVCGGINGCHGVGFAHPDDYPGDASYFKPLNSGSHQKHLKYRFTEVGNCEACHLHYSGDDSGCGGCHGVHTPFINHIDHNIHMEFDTYITVGGAYSGNSSPGSPYGFCSALYCHSDGTYVASGTLNSYTSIRWGSAPLSCNACHGYPPAYPAGSPKANSHQAHGGYSCNRCHYSTTTDGLTISTSRYHVNKAYDVIPQSSAGISFSYAYAPTGGTCNNISCHHGGSATWGAPLACNGCHDSPPATASHLAHFSGSVAQAGYGDVRIAQDFSDNSTGYIMNCGNCHPLDPARHGDGVVQVELFNSNAPAGSLKALNPASAAYANGTTIHTDSRGFTFTSGSCSNIYCHSYNDWTTPGGVPDSAPCADGPPPNLVTTRIYRQVMWGGSLPGNCTGCHASPPQTRYPANDGGSGDSHSTINMYSEEELHTWNMQVGDPLSCTYCHNDTVKVLNKVNRYVTVFNAITTVFSNYSAVPIANFSKHVNGRNDVAFDRTTPVVYKTSGGDTTYNLNTAAYDGGTKTCSNVSCHLSQSTVRWGTPYRWVSWSECDRCHQYGFQCQ